MTDTTRALGYTGSLQTLTWTDSRAAQVRAYLWGAGGGGGGRDGFDSSAGAGGNGTGGAFTERIFTVYQNDTIAVAVGQGGAAGVSAAASAAGGQGGQSLAIEIFNSRQATGGIPQTNPAWSPFMNTYAVWGTEFALYTYSQTINVPYTGYYTLTYAVDEQVTIDIDGNTVVNYSGFTANPPQTTPVLLTAGDHDLEWTAVNFTSARGFALTITQSFSGGNGSAAGSVPFSGGGGGGGGATVLLLNDEIIAIAAGGGGGGGGGKFSFGANAPGPNGQANDGVSAGQNGQSKVGDGGGAGGGGGGYGGGNGGNTQSGDQNGLGGTFGSSLGDNRTDPNGVNAGNRTSPFYNNSSKGGVGAGTVPQAVAGQNGYAAIVFQIPGVFYRQNNSWVPVQNIYIRNNGVWQPAATVNVRDGDAWQQTRGAAPPNFGFASSSWGRLARTNS